MEIYRNNYILFRILLLSFCVSGIFLIVTSFSFAGDKVRIEDPEDLLHVFYKHLISDTDILTAPEIFSDVDEIDKIINKENKQSLNANTEIWKYLKKNKAIFLLSNMKPDTIPERFWYNYLFSGFPSMKNGLFFEGTLNIVLRAPILRDSDGIINPEKQIIFPLVKTVKPWEPRYKINLLAITINGFSLFEYAEKYKKDVFFKELGFTVD